MINPEDPKYSLILGEGNIMSPEQIELCNFAAYGVGNAIVQSYAGSGKSKTIELMCASINPRKKILIIAFNRHIALHLKTKMKNYPNVSVTTYHSFGYKMIMACTGKKPELDEEKYSKYILADMFLISILLFLNSTLQQLNFLLHSSIIMQV